MPGIYIHIPFCAKKCDYCDFYSININDADADVYVDSLLEEMRLWSKKTNKEFDTAYLGGGTPSLLGQKNLARILDGIYKNFNMAKNAEITSEGNPSDFADKGKVRDFKDAGVNRLSVGIQTMNDDTLNTVGRMQSKKLNLKALECISSVFDNYSADVMLGLPREGQKDVEDTVRDILNAGGSIPKKRAIENAKRDIENTMQDVEPFGIKHLSVYALKIEENTPLYKKVGNGEILSQDDDAIADYYDFVRGYLEKFGFERYEVSNFAKKGYACRHNLTYWRRGEYLGLGAAAHSLIDEVRFENPKSLKAYLLALKKGALPYENVLKISKEQALSEKIMLGFRLKEGLDSKALNDWFGIDFFNRYSKALKRFDKCLDVSDGKISIKNEFLYVMNTIITEFL
ncbi:MAG: coproporphyrinogen III oxidase family protein [Clostridiales bacterium]|jgi:oxygen-independent coproporphyrinogen-3 oxidase|nr:coproporphyrinogen III oxidase family protein [Clostridiales bacterium]